MPKSVAEYVSSVMGARKQKFQQETAPLVGQIDNLIALKQKQGIQQEKLDTVNATAQAKQQEAVESQQRLSGVISKYKESDSPSFLIDAVASGDLSLKDVSAFKGAVKPIDDYRKAEQIRGAVGALKGYKGTEPEKELLAKGWSPVSAKVAASLYDTERPELQEVTDAFNKVNMERIKGPEELFTVLKANTTTASDEAIKEVIDGVYAQSPEEKARQEEDIRREQSKGRIIVDEYQTDIDKIKDAPISYDEKKKEFEALFSKQLGSAQDIKRNVNIAMAESDLTPPTEAELKLTRQTPREVYKNIMTEDTPYTPGESQAVFKQRMRAFKNVYGNTIQSGIDTVDESITSSGIEKLLSRNESELAKYGLSEELLEGYYDKQVLIPQYMLDTMFSDGILTRDDIKKSLTVDTANFEQFRTK